MPEYSPRIVYRGKPIAETKWGANAILFDSISLTWGRRDVFEPTEPAILKFSVHATYNDAIVKQFPRGFIGETVVFEAVKEPNSPGEGPRKVTLFVGRIIDCKIEIVDKPKSALKAYNLHIAAADMLRQFGMNLVGEIRSFSTESISTHIYTALSNIKGELKRQGYPAEDLEFSPETKNAFRTRQVYLGGGANDTWLEYFNQIFGIYAKQSFYYNPDQRKIIGTSLPVVLGSDGLDRFTPNSDYVKIMTEIDESKVSGDRYLEFNPKVVGFVKHSYYNRQWKPDGNTFQVAPDARSRGLATMTWKTRTIGQELSGSLNYMMQYLRDQKVLPKPPRLKYQPGTKNIDNPEYWLSPNDSRYAWLANTDHARLLTYMDYLKIPAAKPINGQITYSHKRGWIIEQELRWAIQKIRNF
ncbi:hypothetical protein [Corynebacterium propinquum]|uniref:hypothetical protein n=1 Tax=Corynebacterium propinquum TaxID=43769 RepID=UPI001EF31DD3|nr:hypothetical protein [Corynebacterium propinquum]